MPAIQPAHLKQQIVVLVGRYDQPVLFVRDLHVLLDLYTDHTQRPGQAGAPHPLMSSYNTPPPVMRQVWNELSRKLDDHSENILPLCDALWAESNYDLKLLAVRLLSLMPSNTPEPVMDRLHAWVQMDMDKRLLDGLLEYGLGHLHQNIPDQVFTLVESWLNSADIQLRQAGLRALLPLIDIHSAGHLPRVYRMLTPFVRVAPSRLRPDIIAVIIALVHLSPAETAHLLRQNLTTPNNPDTAWLIRQVIDEFPPHTQINLRNAIKK